MTTPVVLAQARAAQATADREAAGLVLLDAVRAIDPAFSGTAADVVLKRRFEALVEPDWRTPLARVWSGYVKAARAEKKAATALALAQLAPPKSAPVRPVKRMRKSKVAFADHVRERWALEREELAA